MGEETKSLLSAIQFDRYKSFKNMGPYTISFDPNITLIIGKNNSGKSNLIDALESSYGIKANKSNRIIDKVEGERLIYILDEEHLKYGFTEDTYSSPPSLNIKVSDYVYSRKYIGKSLIVKMGDDGYVPSEIQEDKDMLYWDKEHRGRISAWDNVAYSYFLNDSILFFRVNAERDILAEPEDEEIKTDENGNGITNLVRIFINVASYDETIVEQDILEELNKILYPDVCFSGIRVQQKKKKTGNKNIYVWEIFLVEEGNRYALTQLGSGIKTILLILVNLYLLPRTKKNQAHRTIYAFEEIENNLHPALQKRIFEYLYEYTEKHDVKLFITSHSHIAINTYYGKEKTRICHIIKRTGESEIVDVINGVECGYILDDLGAKASDLFQTNGIIWVEGPSDRIYILKWLEIFTEAHYVEGIHFQFMYYGGKLLSHYEANYSQGNQNLINILLTNRNAVLVMDSDIRDKSKDINNTKRRIKEEMERNGLVCWITKGKEIENYLPAEVVNKVFHCKLQQIDQYAEFPLYIKDNCHNFSQHKVEYARTMSQYITYDNSADILDLKSSIEKIYKEISRWNSYG